MKVYKNLFPQIIDPENLFLAWNEFYSDKKNKEDVLTFQKGLEGHVFELFRDLRDKTYRHGKYMDFYISDPKRRHIYKAVVRDRVLHHAVFNILNPIFERAFIPNSFSCRISKGTHKGVRAAQSMLLQVSKNHTHACYVLKCDIQKFFDSINHGTLVSILEEKVKDTDTMWLLTEIIAGYQTETLTSVERERERERESKSAQQRFYWPRKGIPIGNLTSQLFANVYMNKFDQFVKHELRIKHYARYTDDFIIVSDNIAYLESLLKPIQEFLMNKLQLTIHPKKMGIVKYSQGVDFLGYVTRPHHTLIRKRTWKRMLRHYKAKVSEYKRGVISREGLERSLQSYLGCLSHADAYKLSTLIKNQLWFE